MTIGNRIQESRKKKGMTQKELADKIGCAEITIRQYESGKRQPRLNQISQIADALNVSEYFLIYGKDNIKLRKILAELTDQYNSLLEKKNNTDSPKEEYYLNCKLSDIQQSFQRLWKNIEPEPVLLTNINDNLQTRDTNESDLLTHFRQLNKSGQIEASKRVQELTEIPRYTEPDK